jgi:phage tail-like protein
VRKLPGLRKYGDITLKRGVTNSLELWNWFASVGQGPDAAARRNVTIVILDDAGADEARFVVSQAWPAKIEAADLCAAGNEVVIETLVLANEGIERVA